MASIIKLDGIQEIANVDGTCVVLNLSGNSVEVVAPLGPVVSTTIVCVVLLC